MVRASAVTTGATSVTVPTVARAAMRARSRWRATWSRMISVCSRTLAASGSSRAGGLVDHHRERRLQRVREIADMGARALDDLAIGVDQRVGLARERRDLDREGALEPFGGAGADGGRPSEMRLSGARPKRTWKVVVSSSTIAERPEGDGERAVEGAVSSSISAGVARDRDQVAALLAEIDGALDQAQALVLRALDVALRASPPAAVDAESGEVRQLPSHSEREARTSGVGASSRVTCQYQPDSGSSNSGSPSDWGTSRRLLGRGDVGDQRAQIDAEAAVEGALDRLAVERRQHDPGDDQDHHGPGGRREEQAQRERIGAHARRSRIGGVSR